MSGIASILNGTVNGAAGTAQGKAGTTITTFSISLAAGFILFATQFSIFLIIRNYLWAKRIYQPRSFLVPVKQRIKPPHNNPFKWLFTVFQIKEDPEVLGKAGMDAYFFLRFLSMCLKIFTPMAIIIVPILIPLNVKQGKATNTIAGVTYNITGLDTLAWSNVSPANSDRYWAHLILSIGVVAWVCFMFHQELIHYITKRVEYISSPGHLLKASSTTVLIQDIPENLCNEAALEELYGDFPGGIRRIWINRDFTTIVNKDKLRKYYENLLENAETDLLRKVAKRSRKAKSHQAGNSVQASEQVAPEHQPEEHPARPEMGPPTPEACRRDLEYDLETKAAWSRFLAPKNRATMRIPKDGHTAAAKIPLIGRFYTTKIDTIYYCRRELARLNKEIEIDAQTPDAYPQNMSAFVQFNSQKAAHMACQSVADTAPRHMKRRLVEISPGDINWPSLNLSWRSRYIRLVGFLFLFAILLFAFGLISVFTGILSRVSTLSGSTSWLKWIGSLPPWLLSFIQGTLPPVIQVIVLSGPLPILIRLLTNRTRGATTGQEGERSLQLWYFIFLLVELFIIPTVSSGLTSIVEELIRTPTSVPNILATNLPTAANYYFSFLILQALSLSATSILQTIRLFKFYVIGHVNTPDSVFEKLSWTNLTRIGSNVPWYTTFAVIGLVYSTIAPLMLLFMLITFSLFWVVIKNNVLYCVRTGTVDGGGLFFPSAINQLFTGLYFMEICLIGLFFLVRDTQDKVACAAQGIIMAVVFVLTILYQIWLMNHLAPLFKYAPIRLEAESKALLSEDQEERRTASRETHDSSKEINPAPQDEEKDLDLTQNSSTDHNLEPNNQQRPPLWQRQSSNRSKDLQAQQREDTKSAARILARLNAPLNEARLSHLEHKLAGPSAALTNTLLPRRADIEAQMLDDPISKVIMQHNDELENLEPEDRDLLISVAFMHPVLRETSPCVWIPRDDEGVSDDEVRRTRELSADVVIDNRGAFFDRKLKVQVDKQPPDMSEFALIMAEL
ncbi:DUF221-domain-containing protein [Mollisia scopiformis]|uniref:DUF221-domain-containing protein n=1 Tax=Mollisia scopiformis TaxID=149040 RepID=A0A194X4N2_MOLSC|nr:DUF221-domain-containing protein [Mollisia scopiformis]KUJ15135.1 DUF221-domain-containing protein [Mollisia scopiformis]